jgi:hypothetical protein
MMYEQLSKVSTLGEKAATLRTDNLGKQVQEKKMLLDEEEEIV